MQEGPTPKPVDLSGDESGHESGDESGDELISWGVRGRIFAA
jgi:hypothetical protein